MTGEEQQSSFCHGGRTGGGTHDPDSQTPDTLDEFLEQQALRERLGRIRHKIVVLSGKGGVGKSTVAVSLAGALSLAGKRVGLLDADIHGPSLPTMLGLDGQKVFSGGDGFVPVESGGIKVLSLGFLLEHPDDAVIWRGPMKNSVIKQFLGEVAWGDLDFLIIDSPPGTGDEPLSVCQFVNPLDGALIVTTPQKVATVDVRKSITFCRRLKVPVWGVVENMSGFACPHCGEITSILGSGGGRRMAEDLHVPFLGAIPIDPRIAESGDDGQSFTRTFAASPAGKALQNILAPLLALDGPPVEQSAQQPSRPEEKGALRLALPLADGVLALHFGHCERFALFDADPETRRILRREDLAAPPHEPGRLPRWLAERGVTTVIAGGLGRRAQSLFAEQGIQVVVGAAAEPPEQLVSQFLAGALSVGENVCDH